MASLPSSVGAHDNAIVVPTLIEREGQLAAGTDLLRRALGGAGGLLVVEGLARTGKSRLLAELGTMGRDGLTAPY